MGTIAVRLAGLGAQLRRSFGTNWPAWRYRLLLVTWLIAFLLTCNVYLLATVMPAAVRGLGSTVGAVESALVLSPVITAVLVPAGRRLGRLRGRRRVMMWALLAYGAGLIVSAASPTAVVLILGFAVIAGLAGAPLLAGAWNAVEEIFGPERHALGVTVLGTAPIAGTIVGPFLGGFIAEESTWRLAFVAEVALIAVVLWLARSTPETDKFADPATELAGTLLVLVGIACLLVGTSLADDYGWWTAANTLQIGGIRLPPGTLSITPWLIGVGAGLLLLSLFRGLASPRGGARHFLRTGPLANRRFVVGLLLSLSVGIATVGVLYTLLLFLPMAEGLDKFQSGVAVVPFGIGAGAANITVLRLRRQLDARLAVGAGIAASAMAIVMLFVGIAASGGGLALAPGLLVLGAGNGLLLAHMPSLTMSEMVSRDHTEAAGVGASVGDLGYSLGIAILGAVFVGVVAQGIVSGIENHAGVSIPTAARQQIVARLENDLRTLTPEEQDAFVKSQPPNVQRGIRLAADQAFRDGMRYALGASLVGLVLGFLLLVLMPTTGGGLATRPGNLLRL